MKRNDRTEWLFVGVLVSFGVLGRWFQLQWNVTPTAALSLFAGFLLSQHRMALLVPLSILAISNLSLESYNNPGEMLAVYASFLIPVAFGTLVRRRFTAARVIGCTVMSSVLFCVITNFAVWFYRRGEVYANSWAGLLACYDAGLLFFRWMLAGDMFYAALIFGAYALATSPVFQRAIRVPAGRSLDR